MKIIGCMSGTSLDGLDLAYIRFYSQNNEYKFEIIEAKTYEYTSDWKKRLNNSTNLTALELSLLDNDFGELIGLFINEFIAEYHLDDIDYIASHGHTVFHQPNKKLSLQIGKAASIVSLINLPVINDFRTLDMALGGQGAPLVPIGDRLLFSDYDFCLNLGGFSNVSFEQNTQRIAFDIAPANLALNFFAQKLGFEFDRNGALGKEGSINDLLLSKLNQLNFYKQPYPKSLGKEWLEESFLPCIPKKIEFVDVLRTLYEHIAIQIAAIINKSDSKTLVTGGGAFNTFLIDLIKKHSSSEIIIPNQKLVNFKESLIFAFLGYLRVNRKINVLNSVTGASRNSCSGNIVYP